MYKKIKIRLSVFFITGLSIILILLSIAFSIESIESIKYLKNTSLKINQKTIQKTSFAFQKEIVTRIAGEFSGYFTGVANITSIMAEQIQDDMNSKQLLSKNSDHKIVMKHYPDKQLYVSEPSSGVTAYYWGNNKTAIPKKLYFKANILNRLLPFIEEIINSNSGYFYGIWLSGKGFAYTYPRDNFYIKTSNKQEVNAYFTPNKNNPKTAANNENKPVWLMPYTDVLDRFCLSVFTPIYDSAGNFSEAFGIDLNLQKILNVVLSRKLLSALYSDAMQYNYKDKKLLTGFLFIIDQKGKIILFPSEKINHFDLDEEYKKYHSPIRNIQAYLNKSKNPAIQELTSKMIKNSSGIDTINIKGENHIVAYSNMLSPDWILALVIPEKTLIPSARKIKNEMKTTENRMTKHFILIAFIFVLVSIPFMVLFFRFYFLNPLTSIRMGIRKIRKGDFNLQLKENGAAELADLSSAFNYLGFKLYDYIKNLKNEIKARQAVETEIEIAADMQRQILTKTKIRYKKRDFDLFAQLDAAKNVSGDFYDYFYLDDNRLALLIADVSGKGLKAAFFMAMSKVLLKSNSYKYPDNPALVLEESNRSLCLDNEAQMFVTVFLAFYNFKTGELIYANGGHHDAIIVSSTGEYEQFGILKNMALGYTPDLKYNLGRKKLKKEDLLVLFTDGVTEAISPEKEEYGLKRLEQVLVNNKNLTIEQVCNTVVKDVKAFEQGSQFDDITLLTLKKNDEESFSSHNS